MRSLTAAVRCCSRSWWDAVVTLRVARTPCRPRRLASRPVRVPVVPTVPLTTQCAGS